MGRIVQHMLCFGIISLVVCPALFAQKYRLGLENGSTIRANSILVKSPVFGKSYFVKDGSERFEWDQVRFYENEDGYFLKANPTGYGSRFYLRGLHGKRIDAYSTTSTYYSPPTPGGMGGGTFQSSTFDYYQKDGGRLQKMNLANLKKDLNDNALSLVQLKKVSKINTINGILYATGAALLIGGIIDTANSAKNNEAFPPGERDVSLSPLLFVAVIPLNIPWFTKTAKRKRMYEAMELYNGK